ncbi:MAG: L-2-amino-thiazoline-4-carboxylic acid hydrolase [Promethearchaeota archaeon]
MTHFPPFVENLFEIKHHAILCGIIAKNTIQYAGEEGKQSLSKAVRQYGQERGHRMALRARARGDELSMTHFLLYGEWIPEPTLMDQYDLTPSPTLISRVTKCPWCTYWNEASVLEYGQIYCQYVDEALVTGFNPELTLEVKGNLSQGNEFCEFVWHGANKAPEMAKYMEQKSAILGNSCKKSWEYHTSHLYSTFAHVLQEDLGEKGKRILERSLKEFEERFGAQFLDILHRYLMMDFSSINYPNTKITIIGFGHLMESLFPRIIQCLDPAHISSHINATNAEKNQVQEKAEKFGISVSYLNNVQALQHMHPDIIFFAPPPHVARQIIENDLGPYYAELRVKSLPLPDLYAFPPVPSVDYYQQILGEDVHIVTILPNDVRTIHNRPITGEGHHFCTFSKPWPMYNYERLLHLLGDFGTIIPFEPSEIMPILATRVLTTAFIQVVLELQTIFTNQTLNISHHQLAHTCRDIFLQHSNHISPEPPLMDNDLPDLDFSLMSYLTAVIHGWYDGILSYCSDVHLSPVQTKPIVNQMFDLILRQIYEESLDNLRQHLVTAATKGGLLENCIRFIQKTISPILKDYSCKTEISDLKEFQNRLSALVQEASHLVLYHGTNLTK